MGLLVNGRSQERIFRRRGKRRCAAADGHGNVLVVSRLHAQRFTAHPTGVVARSSTSDGVQLVKTAGIRRVEANIEFEYSSHFSENGN
jgi:hypothetical protein